MRFLLVWGKRLEGAASQNQEEGEGGGSRRGSVQNGGDRGKEVVRGKTWNKGKVCYSRSV